MYKISVILPVYNVEKYLVDCIESIVNQSFGFENIQLIMIDDGSTDSSYSIMQEYNQKYDNIKIFHFDKSSGSAGRPRNKGIELAEGKYLMFSDSDDFFSLTAFDDMYKEIEKEKADFVIANWNYADEDGTIWEKPIFDTNRFQKFKLSINDYNNSFYVMNSSMCNKIFNLDFINQNNIRCLEGVPGEDTYFSMLAFLYSTSVFYIPNIVYYYRQRNTGLLSISYNCNSKFFYGMNLSYKALYDKFVENNQINFYKFIYAKNMTYLLCRFIDSIQLTHNERLEILANSRWYYKLSRKLNVPACQKSFDMIIDKIISEDYEEAINICMKISEIRKTMSKDLKRSMSIPTQEMYDEIKKGINKG